MARYTKEHTEEARERLLDYLKPGDTVYTDLRHVSRSGMTRYIDLYKLENGERYWLSGYASVLLDEQHPNDNRHGSGIRVGGCGMDMGFHLVYRLSRQLFPEGFDCIGEGCPSNDHCNSPHPPAIAGSMHHDSGGYALKHRWM